MEKHLARASRGRRASVAFAAILLVACGSDSVVPAGLDDPDRPYDPLADLPVPILPPAHLSYDTPLPPHLRVEVVEATDNTPADNPITDAGATLGRVLFYDRRISVNGFVACASCHHLISAFADNRVSSRGFDGGMTRRNSMSLINLRHAPNGRMFWDERAETLEEQVLMPIQDEVEMGMSLDALVLRLGATSYYPALFADAFGDRAITEDRIARALAQFVRSIVSYGSRFDEGVAAVGDPLRPFPNFTEEENRGKAIFFGNYEGSPSPGLCGNCHMFANPAVFAGPEGRPPGALPPENLGIFHQRNAANNGLAVPDDGGVGDITGDPDQVGTFKVSSLRNVALTAPYMHDGRFATLAEVVDHYDHGVQMHPNLGAALTSFDRSRPIGPDNQPTPIRLDLSAADKAALLAFLETLTDRSLFRDERFVDPFPISDETG